MDCERSIRSGSDLVASKVRIVKRTWSSLFSSSSLRRIRTRRRWLNNDALGLDLEVGAESDRDSSGVTRDNNLENM